MKRTPVLLFGLLCFGMVMLACNLGTTSTLPPTLVPRVTDTPQPTIGYSTLSPTELPNTSGVEQASVSVAPALNSDLQNMLNQIEPDRLFIHISAMQNFQTRHVNSPIDQPNTGIGAAYRYVLDQYTEIQKNSKGAFSIIPNPFTLEWNGLTTVQNNVVGVIQGTEVGGGIIVVCAHYDSVSIDPLDSAYYAPGANDNASGVAALIEMARVLSQRPHRATVIFVAFAAEEVGRMGSRAFVTFLQDKNIVPDAVLNMDIIGSQTGPNGQIDDSQMRLYSVGPNDGPDSRARQLARAIALIDSYYVPNMQILVQDAGDREGRYSDHLSFSDVGIPAVRFIEALEDRARQHTPQDTIDDVQATYLTRNTQTILTVLTVMADGLPPPRNIVLRSTDSPKRTLIWEPVPGAVSYLIALRRPNSLVYDQSFTWPTTSVDWEGFVSTQFAGVAVSSIDANGLMGPPSLEYTIP